MKDRPKEKRKMPSEGKEKRGKPVKLKTNRILNSFRKVGGGATSMKGGRE